VIGLGAVLAGAGTGWGQTDGVFFERLARESEYSRGCYDPCACPITTADGMRGTMVLRRIGENQLFTTYAVENVHLVPFFFGGWSARLTGSGTFRTGGEFARVQEMQLDLRTDGGPPEHFFSGVVVASKDLPELDITLSINGMYCFDTVIRIVADQDCGDFNGDGEVTSQDFFDYLGAFFAGEPGADYDLDGEISSQDFFAFLTAFFGGCA
jgi:hypothetical protein